MIQRIQSIYLFLAAACLGSTSLLPLATASGDATVLASSGDNYFADGVFWAKEHPGAFASYLVAAAAIWAIFLFKNRQRQMQLAMLSTILTGLLIVLMFVLGYYYAQRLPEGTTVQISTGAALFLTAIPLLLLAHRAIKKDEELVRSSDRLR
jgi:hypothetical protein